MSPMPNVFTYRWKTCPPFEFEFKYSMGSCLGGLGFLGALHNINCQKNCHSTSHKERCTCSIKARRRCRGNARWVENWSPPFGTPFHHLFYSALTVLKCVEHA